MSETGAAAVLIVDDRPQNLLALEAILEPLEIDVVKAGSGDEALGTLLRREVAAILLDVQMPGLDGFQTAEMIKSRKRTRHIPIVFLTAISKEPAHVFRGYSAGAVDYIFKPFDPDVLRSKVAVFVDLWRKERQLQEQAEELTRREVAEATRESEERSRRLSEALPAIVWWSDPEGGARYYNERWYEYTGIRPEDADPGDWTRVIHADDLGHAWSVWEESRDTGEPFETEYRFRRHDGAYRWHLGRAVPATEPDGTVVGWVGAAIDIDDRKRAEEGQRFLVEAGAILGRSLAYEDALGDVANAAVPGFADWCTVDLLAEGGTLRRLATAHADPLKLKLADELRERYPPDPDAEIGVHAVVRTGRAQLVEQLSEETLAAATVDDLHRDLLLGLGLRSFMCVPLRARGAVVGAMTFVLAESGRLYGPADLELVEELGRRAETAIENARLYEEVEERARAARVLAAVADGVVMIDRDGVIRLWNPAAARITGLSEESVLGRPIEEVVPRWTDVGPRIPIAGGPGEPVRAETTPVEIGGRELWISGSGVGVEEGTVYAFRDLTEERALEQLKSDFVATVSHEIRTPLAAVHGSALTLLRNDLPLTQELKGQLLTVIADESARLAQTVNDLLLASHLDSGRLSATIAPCDALELAGSVVEAATTRLPPGITVELEAGGELPPVAADPGQLRQVLSNLVDNAIKYSPEGGPVRVRLEPRESHMCFSVIDRGLGIPPSEHRRVFEKFYRLDPNMTRGIGGTGLGLYISRELVRTMEGRVWVESRPGEGSTFHVEIPLAHVREPATAGEPLLG